MKNMKKILAIVLAALMLVGMTAAFADDPVPTPEGATADGNVKISGLDNGDEVTMYQVLQWGAIGNNAGWVLTDAFKNDTTLQALVANINKATTTPYTLTEADVNAITSVINASGFSGSKITGTAASGEFSKNVDPGMYIALVKPIVAGTLYNPIVVSADYNADNGTNEIGDSSSLLTSTKVGDSTTLAKKETDTVTKTATEYDHDAGDEVEFTITTTIPAFAEVYKDPFFNVSDKLSTGLVLKADSIQVTTSPAVAYKTPIETTTDSFKIEFDSDAIHALKQASSVTITYKATVTTEAPLNVNEENNTATVEFSNNPNDENGKTVLKDGTNHYTFDIDAQVLGDSSYRTGELVKVGKDANGSDILAMKQLSNTSSHSALEGATFGLYTDEACENKYVNKIDGVETTWDHITSDANGLFGMDGMTGIRGLDAGTYYLKEISAPAGYIKSTKVVPIVISAVIEDVDVEETIGGQKVTYKVPTLKSYKITVDGKESQYTVTNAGPSVTKMTTKDSSSEIVNTKGVELPSTGGIGTTLFYIGGSILVLAAVILLVTKRRMSAED